MHDTIQYNTMLHLSLISRNVLPLPATYSYCRFRFVSRASSAASNRKEEWKLKQRDAAIRKAAARLAPPTKPEKPLVVDWKSLWWVGLVPLMGVGALAAFDETWRDQMLSGSRIYNYFN